MEWVLKRVYETGLNNYYKRRYTNLLSNSSGELVSTYETFQRQSIGVVPENRASPFSFLSTAYESSLKL